MTESLDDNIGRLETYLTESGLRAQQLLKQLTNWRKENSVPLPPASPLAF